MASIIECCKQVVWGAPTILLILGTGIYLSIRLGWIQLRLMPEALRMFWDALRPKYTDNGVTPFQALCTALAATVGTGNLVGVAGAISLGGPGAIFWMWICGLIGMALKYAEAVLAVRFRIVQDGEYVGGPMYSIQNGLLPKWHFLATLYCIFGVFAAFGVGNATQTNAVIDSMNLLLVSWGMEPDRRQNLLLGAVMAAVLGILLWGGAKRIGRAAERLVPIAALMYVVLCAAALVRCRNRILYAFYQIIVGAFSPGAVTGGVLGSAFLTLRTGVSRGVFTNEAGMGTASIAHASAAVAHPAQQGMMGLVEVFLDTIVICTLTALVILCSGVPIPFGVDSGSTLTLRAFDAVFGSWSTVFLTFCLCCFAFATILGWGLYGARCAQYLFGSSCWKMFSFLQVFTVLVSSVLKTGTVWSLAEIVNGLMAIPNLLVLLLLSPELIKITQEHIRKS